MNEAATDGHPLRSTQDGAKIQSELARDFRTLLRGDIIPEEVSDGKACPSQPGVQA